MIKTRTIAWFSCGAASAVASKFALDYWLKHKNTDEFIIAYIYLKNEHEDSQRFLLDCEDWFNYPITILMNEKYNADVDEVIYKARYMSGVYGAMCTKVLKKEVRYKFQQSNDIHVFGMTVEEKHRLDRLIDTEPDTEFISPLIDKSITKEQCFKIISEAGIELPIMYKMGYSNNNCIGCLKASSVSYWNKIRKDFKVVFDRRAKQEEMLGVALCKMSVNKFKNKYPEEYNKMKNDFNAGKVKWVVDSNNSLRIPLRYLPITPIKQKELNIGNCGFFCESKS